MIFSNLETEVKELPLVHIYISWFLQVLEWSKLTYYQFYD